MALKQVKNKIIATKKTGQVTKAMEAVSAVKMRKSQEKAIQGRPYVLSALRILARLSRSEGALRHPLIVPRESGRKLLIVITSDKGLAGSVNSAVLKLVDNLVSESRDIDMIAIGRKAVEYANRSNITLLGSYTNVSDDVSITDMTEISEKVFTNFSTVDYASVEVVYQNFLSTFEQEPTHRKILPIDSAEIHFILQGIRIKTAKPVEDLAENMVDYLVEPSESEVLDSLIPRLVEIMIYHALIETKASEHSARMVAMKSATDKARDMVKALTIQFNKARQAAITAEVSEITAGVEALK